VHPLLHAERRRRSLHSGRRALFAFVAPLGNLFFCAYFERHMAAGDDGGPLQLFLTIEVAVLALAALIHFTSVLREILQNARVLPVTGGDRLFFTAAAIIRDPLSLGLHGSTAFGCTIMMHTTPAAIPLLVMAVFLPGVGMQVLVGSAMLTASERSDGAAGITLLAMLSMLACLLWSMSYREGVLPVVFPPVVWAATAIDSAIHGATGVAIVHLAALAAFPLLTLGAARWWAERR
jgi:hypothetical protein